VFNSHTRQSIINIRAGKEGKGRKEGKRKKGSEEALKGSKEQ